MRRAPHRADAALDGPSFVSQPPGVNRTTEALERWIDRLWIDARGAGLRDEDRKKARELGGVLDEVGRAVDRISRRRDPLVLVDAAAGKGYVGLLAPGLVFEPRGRRVEVHAIERDPARVQALLQAAARGGVAVNAVAGDVGDPDLWPAHPDIVVALHACGDASDRVIELATARRARCVLVAPCCVAGALPAARRAVSRADALGLPRSGALRRGFVESMVMAERTLALEAAGWRTEVTSFAPPSVTPHGLLLRAERVGEPRRMDDARLRLERLRAPTEPGVSG